MRAISPVQLAEWFDAHAASLRLYARQWLEDPAAEDVVQECFLRLMSQPGTPANVRAWLFRTARNEVISTVRSRKRRMTREQTAASQRADYFESHPADLIDARAAQAAMETLPGEQREVVVLRLWGQMTLAEIAQTIESPLSTVHDRYCAALRRLRETMEMSCKTQTP